MNTRRLFLSTLLLILSLIPSRAQFVFVTNNGAITITSCTNAYDKTDTLIVPDTINGLPVVGIGYYACSYKSMTNVVIGNNITNIGPYAFWSCLNLHTVTIPKSVIVIGFSAFCADGGGDLGVFFQGNSPVSADGALCGMLYYLPGTKGWDQFLVTNYYSGKLWNPVVQTTDVSFGVRTNQFGFNISGTADIPIIVEASIDIPGSWVPLQAASLTNGLFYFTDSDWMNHPKRFYRIRSP